MYTHNVYANIWLFVIKRIFSIFTITHKKAAAFFKTIQKLQ